MLKQTYHAFTLYNDNKISEEKLATAACVAIALNFMRNK
jgi:hypothetical protein